MNELLKEDNNFLILENTGLSAFTFHLGITAHLAQRGPNY